MTDKTTDLEKKNFYKNDLKQNTIIKTIKLLLLFSYITDKVEVHWKA